MTNQLSDLTIMKYMILLALTTLTACQTPQAASKSNIKIPHCSTQNKSLDADERARLCFQRNGENLSVIHQHAISRNPDSQGSIKYEITTGAHSEVINMTIIENTVTDSRLIENLTAYIRIMKFDKSLANEQFTHTLNLFTAQ